ncbi:Ni/Fe-hydrogenase, b-type cytochrome subunit [Deferribacter autotrophicus]|uniref:Ni/Fe-hydrogenase, b-type cytochrome subunit n=1 Tax=Deferribacter autotrophicus TaxID=500465 RepID=A0A5A8F4L9_9BACT|nr:Ni/Fe-hydrogenase, b-type cytochrome subunit [Deferribacter autotrophicus]KAA0258907.1 Ni/Fe-hydrogenase, b-type cytochrome subunit [Deferribacter autotrophicus]
MKNNDNIKCAAKRYIYVWEAPVRISHWLNFLCIITLSITGYYIHNPFIHASDIIETTYIMGMMRYLHYLVGVIFAFSVMLRLFWLFVGNRYASWHSFSNPFRKEDRKTFFAYIKYYTFLEKNPPHTLGHNPVALVAYIVLFNLFILQIITGFALWAQADPNSTLYALTSWVFSIASNQWVRFFHYLMMFLIAGFVINHLYSAILFDFKTQSGEISSIFSGWKPERNS